MGLSVYIHVPFCMQKCTYCDFYTITSEPAPAADRASQWLAVIAQEFQLLAEAGALPGGGQPIDTIFFGGGTPSLASPAALQALITSLARWPGLAPGAEITLEIQPGTCDAGRAHELVAAGINRFSVGAQTFNPRVFAMTARRHEIAQTRAVIEGILALGAELSIDLIFGWPGQTVEEWEDDVRQVLQYAPAGLSAYELTYHKGTEMARRQARGEVAPLDEDLRAEMFETASRHMTGAGYEHYEISNYAARRPDGTTARSRHNVNYWLLGDFAGLGAGAHSFIFPERYLNPHDARRYEETITSGELFRQQVPQPDPHLFAVENLQSALRLSDGVNLDWFAARFGADIRDARPIQWATLIDAGLITVDGPQARATPAGWMQLDSVIASLL